MSASTPSAWEAPPERRRLKAPMLAEWAPKVANVLRRRPMEWAVLRRFDGSTSAWTARRTWIDSNHFLGVELKAERTAEGGSVLMGRWNPSAMRPPRRPYAKGD